MKILSIGGIALGVIILASAIGLAATQNLKPQATARKIVVFQTGVNEPAKQKLLDKFGGTKVKTLPLIGNADAVYLPPQAVPGFVTQPEVLRVDDDLIVTASAMPTPKATKTPLPQPAQTIPWGIDRIDADLAWSTTSGSAIKVAVLDTGIDLDHPDLANNVKGGVNTINSRKTAQDDNGHGTHVAGTIAAENNSLGVVGVAPQAYLYAVKVLNRNGSGFLSDVIEGLQWSISNGMKVVNMSFGSTDDNTSFHDAITATYNAGLTLVAAAGNAGPTENSVTYPARYSEVIAVSASTQTDTIASFSSRGPEIDLIAPGESINSTYLNDTYKVLSGTSMAAPHVSGTAVLVLTQPIGTYDLDSDGVWDPVEVANKLKATAENLGLTATEQGAGLVDAQAAIQ